jgi:hypothetical protein
MSLPARARTWRAQRRRAIFLEACTCGVASVAAAVGLSALADRFLGLPQGARAAALAAAAAWLLFVVRRGVAAWRAADWPAVFAEAESVWPRTRPLLASAWALRGSAPSPGTSEELREEHLARADRLASELPEDPLFHWSPSRSARLLAVAAFAALASNAVWGDRASVLRALAPWRDPSLERWVETTPGDARPDWGAPVVLRAEPTPEGADRGVRADDLRLESRGADGTWRPLPWTRVAGGAAEWSADALSERLDYRVRWRGLTGRAYRLDPVAPPRWRSLTAVVRGARGAKSFDLGAGAPAQARRGDWIEVEGEADAPLASAELRAASEPAPSAMRVDGGRWRGGFLARADAALTFSLVSADGRRDPSPPAYAVRVAADAPPTAELISPQAPLVASPGDSVPIAYAARDDEALTRVALVVRVAGRPDAFLPLPVASPPQDEALGDFSWPLADFKPGDRVRFWIQAWDDATPPQTGVSEKGSVEIVDADAEHRAALDARAKTDAALEMAAVDAEAARDAARKGDLEGSRARTARLEESWEQARKNAEEWARRAAEDARGDPGLADEAARAAQELGRAGAESLPAATKALARSDAKAAAREQAALADEARGVQRALREGAASQAVQDLADRSASASTAADKAAERAERLAARAGKAGVSPEDLEKLGKALDEVRKALDELQKTAKELQTRSPSDVPSESSPGALDQAQADANEMSRALASGDVAGAARAARRLADRLKKMAQALDQAGRAAADRRGRRDSDTASAVRGAWDQAARSQEAAVESARVLDRARVRRALVAQKELIARVDAELARRREQLARTLPSARWPRGVAVQFDEARRKLSSGGAAEAALLLRDAAVRLRAAAERVAPAATGDKAAESSAAEAFDSAAQSLQAGPAAEPPDPAAARPAAAAQAAARTAAAGLRAKISESARSLGFLSARIGRQVDAALEEEASGETALRAGDGVEGLKRAEAALALLEDGSGDAQSAESAAGRSASASMSVSGGGSVRQTTGSELRRVRLPTAQDYRPPRELREELQRSLSEPRPAGADSDVKEYLERLAR